MISIKNNAASEYYICFAYNDESEIIFGANEKTLTDMGFKVGLVLAFEAPYNFMKNIFINHILKFNIIN